MKWPVLILVISSILLIAGCIGKPAVTDNKISCKSNTDCIPTCDAGSGCVNKDYPQNDCERIPTYGCECVNTKCQITPTTVKELQQSQSKLNSSMSDVTGLDELTGQLEVTG